MVWKAQACGAQLPGALTMDSCLGSCSWRWEEEDWELSLEAAPRQYRVPHRCWGHRGGETLYCCQH